MSTTASIGRDRLDALDELARPGKSRAMFGSRPTVETVKAWTDAATSIVADCDSDTAGHVNDHLSVIDEVLIAVQESEGGSLTGDQVEAIRSAAGKARSILSDVADANGQETLIINGTTYVRHPASAVWGNLDGDEFDMLVASIKDNGQRNPATRVDGIMLDGWQRVRACAELQRDPVVVDADAKAIGDFVDYVNAQNMHRRQTELNGGQRVLKVLDTLSAADRKPVDKEIGRMAGVGRATVGHVKRALRHNYRQELESGVLTADAIDAKLREDGKIAKAIKDMPKLAQTLARSWREELTKHGFTPDDFGKHSDKLKKIKDEADSLANLELSELRDKGYASSDDVNKATDATKAQVEKLLEEIRSAAIKREEQAAAERSATTAATSGSVPTPTGDTDDDTDGETASESDGDDTGEPTPVHHEPSNYTAHESDGETGDDSDTDDDGETVDVVNETDDGETDGETSDTDDETASETATDTVADPSTGETGETETVDLSDTFGRLAGENDPMIVALETVAQLGALDTSRPVADLVEMTAFDVADLVLALRAQSAQIATLEQRIEELTGQLDECEGSPASD